MYRPYPNGSQQPQFSPQSWYPTFQTNTEVVASGALNTSAATTQNNELRPYSSLSPSLKHSSPSSTDAFHALKNKSTEELQRLLSDQDAYNSFLQSCDSVRQIDSLLNELLKRNAELARQNLEKESEIFQLRNQCTIIRTTELATAKERFDEVQNREREVKAVYSPAVLLERLQDAASKVDDESENIYEQLLSGEINLGEFIQSYRKKRHLYHKRVLTRLAAKTSMATPG